MQKRRNVEFDFLRFFFASFIVILHFTEDYFGKGFVRGGYLGVEGFFVLSGFFLCEEWRYKDTLQKEKSEFERAFLYWIDRVKKLYPPMVVAVIMAILVKTIVEPRGADGLLYDVKNYLWSIVPMSGASPDTLIMRTLWYMNALFLLYFVVYFGLCLGKNIFMGFGLIISVLILEYFHQKYQSLVYTHAYFEGFIWGGLLRGFSEMMIGCVISEIIKCGVIKLSQRGAIIIKVVCFVGMSVILLKIGFSSFDFVFLMLVACFVFCSAVKPMEFRGELICYVVKFLGNLSYWMFLLHLIVSMLICKYMHEMRGEIVLIFWVITVAFSAIMCKLFSWSKKIFRSFRKDWFDATEQKKLLS